MIFVPVWVHGRLIVRLKKAGADVRSTRSNHGHPLRLKLGSKMSRFMFITSHKLARDESNIRDELVTNKVQPKSNPNWKNWALRLNRGLKL